MRSPRLGAAARYTEPTHRANSPFSTACATGANSASTFAIIFATEMLFGCRSQRQSSLPPPNGRRHRRHSQTLYFVQSSTTFGEHYLPRRWRTEARVRSLKAQRSCGVERAIAFANDLRSTPNSANKISSSFARLDNSPLKPLYSRFPHPQRC